MPRFIILTQYYPPETGAPQNRLHSLARFLRARGNDVQVLTAMPNYPKNEVFEGYKGRFKVDEVVDEITVNRAWIFVSESRSVASRLLNYFSFGATSLIRLISIRKADYIICESPPLFLGITAVIVSKLKGSKLVFNVSDLWPESAEKLGIVSNRAVLRLSYALEAWIYRHSFLISGQTRGIVKSIASRFADKRVVWVPNGVDFEFFDNEHPKKDWRGVLGLAPDDFVVLYAGIIGHAQGLEVVLRAANLLREKGIQFVIVGDGPEKGKLERLKIELVLANVHFLPNMGRGDVPSLISMCNAYVVPLKKLDLFKGAIPSKLFEPLSMKKPILLGVDGEARELFIEEGKAGLYYEPENSDDLARQVSILAGNASMAEKLGLQGREYVRLNFDRVQIHERFLKEILEVKQS